MCHVPLARYSKCVGRMRKSGGLQAMNNARRFGSCRKGNCGIKGELTAHLACGQYLHAVEEVGHMKIRAWTLAIANGARWWASVSSFLVSLFLSAANGDV